VHQRVFETWLYTQRLPLPSVSIYLHESAIPAIRCPSVALNMANGHANPKRSVSLDEEHDDDGHDDDGHDQGGRQRSRAACAPCRQRKRKWYVTITSLRSLGHAECQSAAVHAMPYTSADLLLATAKCHVRPVSVTNINASISHLSEGPYTKMEMLLKSHRLQHPLATPSRTYYSSKHIHSRLLVHDSITVAFLTIAKRVS